MARNKLQKYTYAKQNKHIINFEHTDFDQDFCFYLPVDKLLRERVEIELGCGDGAYIKKLSKNNSGLYFGIDIKGDRLFDAIDNVSEPGYPQVCYIRSDIRKIDYLFQYLPVDKLWITFPDPYPKKPKSRLTSKIFIQKYLKILKPEGEIILKTDSQDLYNYTKEVFYDYKELLSIVFDSSDLYKDLNEASVVDKSLYNIRTRYEQKYLDQGKNITLLHLKRILS